MASTEAPSATATAPPPAQAATPASVEAAAPASAPAAQESAQLPGTKKQILVLGASFAGISVSHFILRHVVPALPDKSSYHVTLVDPSTEWFNRVAAPRGIISEQLLSIKKFMLPLADGFKEYSAEQFTLVQGKATTLDYAARTVTINKANATSETISYYALIIATGASSASSLLGVQSNHTVSVEAIEAFRKKLPEAKSIVIGGGGPAGVETAGEIGHFLNGSAGFFASRPKTTKAKITLVSAENKLLPVLRPALAKKAEKLLNRVGVDVVYNTKVQSTVPELAGRVDAQGGISTVLEPAKVTLSNGEALDADIFIPAWGLKPNSSWLPQDLLSQDGRVDTNKTTLRVDKAGPRVYAIGDVANYGRGGVFESLSSIPVVNTNIKRDFLHDAKVESSGDAKVAVTGKDRTFEDKIGESQLVPVGRSKGVGAVFNWRLPSFMVWLIKGRDYLASGFPDTLNGKAYKKEERWKHM